MLGSVFSLGSGVISSLLRFNPRLASPSLFSAVTASGVTLRALGFLRLTTPRLLTGAEGLVGAAKPVVDLCVRLIPLKVLLLNKDSKNTYERGTGTRSGKGGKSGKASSSLIPSSSICITGVS